MDQRFLERLPDELRAVVHEVEDLAGCQVVVTSDASASEFDNLTFGIDRGMCRATIAHKGSDITGCALVHEVLHLKRHWVDAVPALRSRAERFEFEAQAWEDLLEHLVIIPEERRFLEIENNAHWRTVMDAKLVELTRLSAVAVRRSLIQQRAMLDIALPDLDHGALYSRLREEKLLEPSTPFIANLRSALNDKMRAIGWSFNCLAMTQRVFARAASIFARTRRGLTP
jgi:hypothetical protein